MNNIEEVIKQVVFENIGQCHENMKSFDDVPNDVGVMDLYADSLDAIDMVFEIEDGLAIEIDLDDFKDTNYTVNDVIEIIEKQHGK
jgi:acyl carrier protein